MNHRRACRRIRAAIARLPDWAVRNLMEHAANETPVIHDEHLGSCWGDGVAG